MPWLLASSTSVEHAVDWCYQYTWCAGSIGVQTILQAEAPKPRAINNAIKRYIWVQEDTLGDYFLVTRLTYLHRALNPEP